MKDQYVLKFCITGSNTDLNCRIVRDTADGFFSSNYLPTTGVDIVSKVIRVHDQEVKLILHTIAGHPSFSKLRHFYYEGSVCDIIMFDKGDPASFAAIPGYYREYRRIQGLDKPITILGIAINSEKITTKEGQRLAAQLDCLYIESHPSNKKKFEKLYKKLIKLSIEGFKSPEQISTFSLVLSKFKTRFSMIHSTFAKFFRKNFSREESRD